MYSDSKLIQQAQGLNFNNWFNVVLGPIAILFLTGIMQIFLLPINRYLVSITNHPDLALFLDLYLFIPMILSIFLWTKYVERRPISSLGLKPKRFFPAYFKGVWIGLGLFFLLTVILVVTNHTTSDFKLHISAFPAVFLLFFAWSIQGSAEEIFSRGWQLQTLSIKFNVVVGLVASSSFFALLHLANPNVNVIAIINLILFGLFIGLYALLQGDIVGACGIHVAWNYAQGSILGFHVSGMNASSSLMKFHPVGNSLYSGGSFGPEASIFTTILFSSLIIYFIYMAYRKKKKA